MGHGGVHFVSTFEPNSGVDTHMTQVTRRDSTLPRSKLSESYINTWIRIKIASMQEMHQVNSRIPQDTRYIITSLRGAGSRLVGFLKDRD